MLLELHKHYSNYVLERIKTNNAIKEQVAKGSLIPDLCEFTNEGYTFLSSKDKIHRCLGIRREQAFRNTAIFQSHFGNLTSLHSMSKQPDEPAAFTRDELASWFEFLNDVALGTKPVSPDIIISSDNVQIGFMFSGLSIDYDQIFDTHDAEEIRYRALGIMLHLIQDSYTTSHCDRNNNDELVGFYCYRLQDKEKHKQYDDVTDPNREIMLERCSSCLNTILAGAKYDYHQILRLSPAAKSSSGGNWG